MDIAKLKEYQDKLNREELKGIHDDLPIGIINFTKSTTVKKRIENYKSGRKTEQSARVLNSWINLGLLEINDSDKGKIKRFNRLTSIWLNLITKARSFGTPIEHLKQTQKDLFKSPVKDFNLIKFSVLETILRQPKILLILEEGHTKVLSTKNYATLITKGLLPPHLNFGLLDLIIPEYPKNAFEIDFKIDDVYENPNKVSLLYYLKTGDFEQMKIFISETDVRLIDTSHQLHQNIELLEAVRKWSFTKIQVFTNNDVEPITIS